MRTIASRDFLGLGCAAWLVGAGVASAQDGMPWRLSVPDSTEYFPHAVIAGGDVTGDGVGDVLAGELEVMTTSGRVVHRWHLFSGADGSPVRIYDFAGDGGYDGRSNAAFLGDLDGDDIDDIGVGYEWFRNANGAIVGRLQILSGATGAVLYDRIGLDTDQRLGRDIVSPGDVNHDGVNDYAFVRNWADDGAVEVRSGADHTLLYEIEVRWPRRLAAAGDIDLDDVPDLIVGRWAVDVEGVLVFSGGDGSLIRTIESDRWGWLVAGGQDVTGDGVPDILASDRASVGYGRLYSGADGAVVREFAPTGYPWYLVRADFSDVNGNGLPEVMLASGQGVQFYEAPDWQIIRLFDGPSAGPVLYGDEAALTDLNRDGFTDAIVARQPGDGWVWIFGGAALGLSDSSEYVSFPRMSAGRAHEFRATDATPGARVGFLASRSGKDCTVVPRFGSCVDLTAPFDLVAIGVADASGIAAVDLRIPSGATPGPAWVQAVELQGGVLAKSNVLEVEITN